MKNICYDTEYFANRFDELLMRDGDGVVRLDSCGVLCRTMSAYRNLDN